MKRWKLFGVVFGVVLAGSVPGAAQDRGMWMAASSNAKEITGDLTISDAKLTLNFYTYPLAPIRELKAAEAAAVFDADASANTGGNLYRLSIPAKQRFLHHNTLCGTEDTQWMATFVTGRELHMALFSGADMPVFTFEAITNSQEVCGRFTYAR